MRMIPLKKEIVTQSSILAWENSWTEQLGGQQSAAAAAAAKSPLCDPVDRGAWWAAMAGGPPGSSVHRIF